MDAYLKTQSSPEVQLFVELIHEKQEAEKANSQGSHRMAFCLWAILVRLCFVHAWQGDLEPNAYSFGAIVPPHGCSVCSVSDGRTHARVQGHKVVSGCKYRLPGDCLREGGKLARRSGLDGRTSEAKGMIADERKLHFSFCIDDGHSRNFSPSLKGEASFPASSSSMP